MKSIRFISLVLAMILSLAIFSGCGNTSDEQTTTTPPENTEEQVADDVHPEIAKKSYNSEFYFSIMTHVNQSSLYWVKESDNDVLTDAVYKRQEYIRDYLGVDMYAIDEETSESYISRLQTAVKNRDDSIHMSLSHTFMGIDGFITGNYLTDFNDIDIIDLTSDYWNYDFMEEVSINGHFYLGYSDFNIARTQVVAFNKEMYSKYEDAIGEEFYDMVTDYR